MADLISAREMLSVVIGSFSPGCKTGWWICGGTSSKCSFQRASCSSALARISASLLRIGLVWLGFLVVWYSLFRSPLLAASSASAATNFLYLPSLDSILLHSISFFKPSSGPINICFQLPPFLNLPPSVVREPLLSVPFHFSQNLFACFTAIKECKIKLIMLMALSKHIPEIERQSYTLYREKSVYTLARKHANLNLSAWSLLLLQLMQNKMKNNVNPCRSLQVMHVRLRRFNSSLVK